jgi:hypothetical protein
LRFGCLLQSLSNKLRVMFSGKLFVYIFLHSEISGVSDLKNLIY